MALDVEFGSPLPDIALEGAHFGLRPFRHDDLPLIEEVAQDDFIPTITTVPDVYSADEALAFLDRQNFRLSSGEGWSLAIVDVTNDQALGQIGLWISHLRKGRAEIGYWVAPSGRNRGAAAAGVGLLSDWAFAHLDVDRLSLFIEPWNVASQKTAERAGYEREVLLKNWERVAGVSKDMWAYVRLANHDELAT